MDRDYKNVVLHIFINKANFFLWLIYEKPKNNWKKSTFAGVTGSRSDTTFIHEILYAVRFGLLMFLITENSDKTLIGVGEQLSMWTGWPCMIKNGNQKKLFLHLNALWKLFDFWLQVIFCAVQWLVLSVARRLVHITLKRLFICWFVWTQVIETGIVASLINELWGHTLPGENFRRIHTFNIYHNGSSLWSACYPVTSVRLIYSLTEQVS